MSIMAQKQIQDNAGIIQKSSSLFNKDYKIKRKHSMLKQPETLF